MQKLQYSIHIDAPVETVWQTMLDDVTYRDWTTAFSPGSYYTGDWSEGSEIKFLGPDPETGAEGGMAAKIKENRLHEYVSVEHYGYVQNGEVVKQDWAPAYENYTFSEHENGTLLQIDMDCEDEYAEMMSDMWPKALARLKKLAEGQ